MPNSTSKQDVINFVASCGDRDSLKQIGSALKVAYDNLERMKVVAFAVNDKVTFDSRRGKIKGVVSKINSKTIQVKADGGCIWRVSPSFLTKV